MDGREQTACIASQIPQLMWLPLCVCFFGSVCALAGGDGQPEQRAGRQGPGGHLALHLYHQRRPQQPVHHLDGDAAGQR